MGAFLHVGRKQFEFQSNVFTLDCFLIIAIFFATLLEFLGSFFGAFLGTWEI
jgi:hypothetical protein